MYFPSKSDFIKKSKQANLIPVYKEIFADFLTPLSAYKKIEHSNSFLFESVEGGEKIARYSFLGSDPSLVFLVKGDKITVKKKSKKQIITSKDPFGYLKKFMGGFKPAKVKGLPRFYGGLVGYIGYDCIRFFEKMPNACRDDLKLHDAVLMLTDTILIFDHLTRKLKIVSNVCIEEKNTKALQKQYTQAISKIEGIIAKLDKPLKETTSLLIKTVTQPKPLSNFTKTGFKKAILKAEEYIKKGDIIQVVLSQRFEAKFKKDPIDVYRALRSINPSPYMFYLALGKIKLVGSSPEVMVRSENGVATVRPIAGTRKRGLNKKQDNVLAKELLSDEKERAEHLMLVDLARNDLGRIAKSGTVKVAEFMVIEKYSHVMHIVSECTGILKANKTSFDVLRACFPAGTVSGAPKIRAMEIIDELESVKRGPYAGCVGYFSFTGNMDTCITIRTILIKGHTAYVQAGAGIVADSSPGPEFKETQKKQLLCLRR